MISDNNEQNQGVESGVSEDAFENTPALHQDQTEAEQEKWQKALEASRKERKGWDDVAVKALKRYRDERSTAHKDRSFYNIFFLNTEQKLAALYARTPKADIKRRFDDIQDDVSRVAGLLLQRNVDYEMDNGSFEGEFKQVLFDNAVPGMGVSWVRLDQDVEQHAQPDAQHPLTGEPISQEPVTVITNQEACTDYVAWDDFFWSPCKVWTLCSWVARRIPMTKDAIKARFSNTAPADVLAELSYSTKPDAPRTNKAKLAPQNQTEATADIYEIWDKERKLVFWVTEEATIPLDVQPDTMDFEGFFPTPMPPLGRFDTSNTQPISDYQLVKGKYEELDKLNERCSSLIDALGVKFVYDSSSPEIKELYTTTGENQGIGVKNWASFSGERGGLQGSIQFAPLDQVANTFNIAATQLERIKAQIYEVEGISDIMRGESMPYETATATAAKNQQSGGRFASRQHDVAKYVEKLLRLKAHVICKFYQPDTIVQRAMPLAPEDQQFIGPALQMLKDEQMGRFRLSVSVDSLQLANWNTENAERQQAIQAITKMMSVILPAVQQNPEVAPLGLELIKFGISGFKGAQAIEGVVDNGLQQLMQVQKGQGQQKQPTPDQTKAQAIAQKAQLDYQAVQMQEQTKLQIAQMQAQVKQAEAAQTQQQNAFENRLRAMEAQIRQGELASTVAHQQAVQVHDASVDLMNGNRPVGGQ
jgi:hypothetical protein